MKNYLLAACVLIISHTAYSQTDRETGSNTVGPPSDPQELERIIEEITEEIRVLNLERDYLIFSKYISYCQQNEQVIPVFSMPRGLYDEDLKTIDSLIRYRAEFEQAKERKEEILLRHPHYRALTEQWEAAENLQIRDSLSQERRAVVARYFTEDDEYNEAFEAQTAALRRSNEAIAWRILDVCRQRGEPVPTANLRDFRQPDRDDAELNRINTRLQALRHLLSVKTEQYYKLKYGSQK